MFQPRPHQPRFTDEQMIEIGRAREKLEAIRNKCQPYPTPITSGLEPASTPSTAPEPQWSRGQWQSVQQVRAMLNHLENKLLTHLTPPKEQKQQGIKI